MLPIRSHPNSDRESSLNDTKVDCHATYGEDTTRIDDLKRTLFLTFSGISRKSYSDLWKKGFVNEKDLARREDVTLTLKRMLDDEEKRSEVDIERGGRVAKFVRSLFTYSDQKTIGRLESLQATILRNVKLSETRFRENHEQILNVMYNGWIKTRKYDKATLQIADCPTQSIIESMSEDLLDVTEDFAREIMVNKILKAIEANDGNSLSEVYLRDMSLPETVIKDWTSTRSYTDQKLDFEDNGLQRQHKCTLESDQTDCNNEKWTRPFHMLNFPFRRNSSVQKLLMEQEKRSLWPLEFGKSVLERLGSEVPSALKKASQEGDSDLKKLISASDIDRIVSHMSGDILLQNKLEDLLKPTLKERESSGRTGQGTMTDLSIMVEPFKNSQGELDFTLCWSNEDQGAGYFFDAINLPNSSTRRIHPDCSDYSSLSALLKDGRC
ncbi:uncharacterized protein I206_105371 [Kwoniella pini CBS 10737]|uniref:Uncharacterized protein n=1 Tax=Kwoniella pini CBS 10737 TaxID=1296096 RepID=A0A1B9I4F9_9TREE|nr:uncharacterized protein I206_03720 [Kwoniella pini CBS 10737]OCF50399.1 hypothetical protein I206_03720 [Kwoniella pini CBS 10737]